MNSIWILGFLSLTDAIHVGFINNSEYRPIDSVGVIFNGSCDECLCHSLANSTSSPYKAFNCFENQRRCEFYLNYSRWYNMIGNSDSKFYFFDQLPPLPSCYSDGSNTSITTPSTNLTSMNGSVEILWPFDSTFADTSGRYNGTAINFPTFISPGFAGYGAALSLNGNNQYFMVVGPHLNFSYRSFSLEAWIYANTLSPAQDYVILNQCTSTAIRRCLVLMFRLSALRLAFWGDDCQSETTVLTHRWHHVAFVYDYPRTSKRVYLNGELVCINTSSSPYEGTVASTYIGIGHIGHWWAPWNGLIDQLLITFRAKSTDEVLEAATLVVYYAFNNASYLQRDSGPLSINGVLGAGISHSSAGRVGSCLEFSGTSVGSYFQTNGLRRLGIQNYPFSFSLWLKPTTIHNATIIHLSSGSVGTGWCVTLMGFSTTGQLVTSVYVTNSLLSITAMSLPIHSWTHIVSTFSPENGLRLYINGTLFGAVNGTSHQASGTLMTVTLGNVLNGTLCASATPSSPYQGLIDEFRLYSRELTQTDVCTLSNV